MKLSQFNKPVKKKTGQDKTIKHRLKKRDFVGMLSDVEKYPLLMRIAAELFRNGVSGRRFLDEFHLDGNSMSTQIHVYMVDFDLKRGLDPAKVPPILPEFIRWIEPAKIKELKAKAIKGRPTAEQAAEHLAKVLKECLSRGWDEVDFINAIRRMDQPTGPIKSVKLELDEDDEPETKKKVERAYFARIGKKWDRFETQVAAMKAMREDDDRILGPVEEPVQGEHCFYCKFRLNGTVVTVRDNVSTKHMHMGCYWMNAHPTQIQIGMCVLDALTGKYYTYHGADKGGWKVKEENETPVTVGDNQEGISETSREAHNKAATLPSASKA